GDDAASWTPLKLITPALSDFTLSSRVLSLCRNQAPTLRAGGFRPLRPIGFPSTSSCRHGLTECNGPPHGAANAGLSRAGVEFTNGWRPRNEPRLILVHPELARM